MVEEYIPSTNISFLANGQKQNKKIACPSSLLHSQVGNQILVDITRLDFIFANIFIYNAARHWSTSPVASAQRTFLFFIPEEIIFYEWLAMMGRGSCVRGGFFSHVRQLLERRRRRMCPGTHAPIIIQHAR